MLLTANLPTTAFRLLDIILIISSVGLFIFGMKIISEGMQQLTGSKLRKILGSTKKSSAYNLLSGISATAIVQSSSITTLSIVSLVNAGMLSLKKAVHVILGANIGITITAWIILLFGFKFNNTLEFALLAITAGTPLLFLGYHKSKYLANILFGFGIILLGLFFVNQYVPSLNNEIGIDTLSHLSYTWYGNIMFVLIGIVFTIIIQSSTAAFALTMSLLFNGLIPFDLACNLIIGANVGTSITSELGALNGNVHARRAARIHTVINIIGMVWMLILFSYFLKLIYLIVGDNVTENVMAAVTGLALFHTLFNCINVFVLLWFTKPLVKLIEKALPSSGKPDEEFKLEYIGDNIMASADLSIMEAKKELIKFGNLTIKMADMMSVLLFNRDLEEKVKMAKKIKKYEEITDRIEVEIAEYLEKVSQGEMSKEASAHVRSKLRIINDLERIGDIFYQMSITVERKERKKIWFTQEQRDGISQMLSLVHESLELMKHNLKQSFGSISLDEAIKKENAINEYRNLLRKNHLSNLEKGAYKIESGMIYNDLYSSLEKIGDHVINVSEAVAGKL